jgi:hypothetical protein
VERCVRVAVDADQLGGDALADFRLVPGLGEDHEPGVRVHVDEAGADHVPLRVDAPAGLDAAGVAAQDTHALVLDRDVPEEARVAGAVDDESSADEQVEHRGLPSGERVDGGALLGHSFPSHRCLIGHRRI